MPGKRLTPEEAEYIIGARLKGVSYRVIADELGRRPNTVMNLWNAYLRDRAEVMRDQVEEEHQRSLMRLEYLIREAMKSYEECKAAVAYDSEGNEVPSPDRSNAAKFLAEAKNLELAYAKLAGISVERLELTGPKGGPVQVEDPKTVLLARLAQMQPPTE